MEGNFSKGIHLGKVSKTLLRMLCGDMVVAGSQVGCTIEVEGSKTILATRAQWGESERTLWTYMHVLQEWYWEG